jgi:hypothetical protein
MGDTCWRCAPPEDDFAVFEALRNFGCVFVCSGCGKILTDRTCCGGACCGDWIQVPESARNRDNLKDFDDCAV